jgi:stage II sporulation protein E
MGSGPDANRESSLAVRLLEQFLLAGVNARHALTTLSSALALRGEQTGGFTTVDLLQVDLFSGDGELFKLGAAPTYIKKGNEVQRLSGTSLPAGLPEGDTAPLDQFRLHLSPGDTVLMVSDGICGTGEDNWLKEKLSHFDGASPKDLARTLITDSPQEATDDRTALVIRLEKRT